mmetsp:Transcript_13688/g.32197  ORF Transcript_13688/g.32197 Transcript_13688/m.32197 type:complete len:306 (-) Transcript_13688:88-1005(-)
MAALKLAAATVAVLPAACDAFVAPSSLRGDAQAAQVTPEVTMQQQFQQSSCSKGVIATAACAVVAGVAAKASSRPARKSRATTVVMQAEAEEVKMSPAVPYLPYPTELEGWVGGEKGFDPLKISDIVPVYYLREAELKHGRICMLATLGWIAVDCGVRFQADVFQNVGVIQAHNAMVEAGYMQQLISVVGVFEIFGLYLMKEAEKGAIQRQAGDFFFGKNFLPSDPEQADQMRLKELENGRLAMLAFSGLVTQAVLFPESHFPYLDFSGVAQVQYDGVFADLANKTWQTKSLLNPMMWFKKWGMA